MSAPEFTVNVKRGCDQGIHRIELWVDENHEEAKQAQRTYKSEMPCGIVMGRCPLCNAVFSVDALPGLLGLAPGAVVTSRYPGAAMFGEPVGPKPKGPAS